MGDSYPPKKTPILSGFVEAAWGIINEGPEDKKALQVVPILYIADVPEEGGSEMVALRRSCDKKGEVMIGILGSMNETLKGVKGDTGKMLEKQDETIVAIDRSEEEIVTEISPLRDDLRLYMEEKFTKIEHDVEAIKTERDGLVAFKVRFGAWADDMIKRRIFGFYDIS
jgi:hypothetical protein